MIAQVVNMLGLIQTDGDRLFETAGYLVSRLYAEETLPLSIGCEVECETFSTPVWTDIPEQSRAALGDDLTDVPFVDVSVTVSDDRSRMAVFMVNRYLDEAVRVDLDYEGLRPPASGRIRRLAAESPFARNDFDKPDRLRIRDVDARSSSSLELPPHSVSVLLLG